MEIQPYLKQITDFHDDSLLKTLDSFQLTLKKPSLFVSEYFYSIRNEIDIEAESSLILNFEEIRVKRVNEMRQLMINELSKHEKEILNQLNQLRLPQNEESKQFQQFECKYEKHKNDLALFHKSVLDMINESSTKASLKEIYFRKRINYDDYYTKINEDLNDLKSFLLNKNSILFKKSHLNDFGFLIIFEEIYMNDLEIDFIK